jgi:hypothetical protein
MAPYIKRDLYSEVTSRILAELEGRCALGEALVGNARAERSTKRSD